MRYIVEYRMSRTQLWTPDTGYETLEEAIEAATRIWKTSIDINAYIDVRIGKQYKKNISILRRRAFHLSR
jgi:hypothetical protein